MTSRFSTSRKALLLFFLSLGLVLSTSISAAAQTLSPSELIERAGIDALFDGAVRELRNSTSRPDLAGNPKLKLAWQEAVDSTISPEILKKALVAELNGQFSADEIGKIATFLDSPFGRKVTEMEVRAQSAPQEQMMTTGSVLARSHNQTRQALLNAILDSIGGREAAIDLTLNASYGIFKGMQAAGSAPLQYTDAMIWQILESQRPVITQRVDRIMRASMAFTYRELSEQELGRYVAFLGSDAGRAMYGKITPAIGNVFRAAMTVFGHRLMVLMGHKRT